MPDLCSTCSSFDKVDVAMHIERERYCQKFAFHVVEATHSPRAKAVVFQDVSPCLAILQALFVRCGAVQQSAAGWRSGSVG